MSLPTFNKDMNIIGALADDPALSSSEFKAKFDEGGKAIQEFLNGTGAYAGNGLIQAIQTEITNKLGNLKPVGSLYFSTGSENPTTIFGGTWEKIQDAYLKGSGTESAGATGGSNTKTILKENLPNYNLSVTDPGHSHSYTKVIGSTANDFDRTFNGSGVKSLNENSQSTASAVTGITVSSGGSETPLNIEPSYFVVNIWKRTA